VAATKPVGPKIAASTSCSRTEVFVGTLARRRWLASAQARTHSTVGPAAVLACPKGTVHAQHLSGQQAPSAQRTCPELRAARSRTRNYTLCTKHICPRATFCPRSRDHSPKTYCARRVYFVLRIVVAWSRGRVVARCPETYCARRVCWVRRITVVWSLAETYRARRVYFVRRIVVARSRAESMLCAHSTFVRQAAGKQ